MKHSKMQTVAGAELACAHSLYHVITLQFNNIIMFSECTCCWGGNIIESCEVVSVTEGVDDVGGVPLPLVAA